MKRFLTAAVVVCLLAGMVSAFAGTAGTSSDPLISLSYVTNTYQPSVMSDASSALSAALGSVYGSAVSSLEDINDSFRLRVGDSNGYTLTRGYTPMSIPSGKSIYLRTGGSFILNSGAAAVSVVKGTVINIPTGSEIASGTSLSMNQRYFCAEDTTAVFSASSASSCLIDGYYTADSGVSAGSGLFTDVRSSDWFYDAVYYAKTNKLFSGTSETAFSPQEPMTRAMFVTVLYRLAGSPSVGSNSAFPDVSSSQYYCGPVIWASENGIVTGFTDGNFKPDDSISREQMAAVMYRYASYAGCVPSGSDPSKFTSFPDKDSVSPYAKDAMIWATAKGVINGSDGKLLPSATAARAQVAQITMNFCRNIVGM